MPLEVMNPEQEKFYRASQWQLMWWKFRKHKLAMIGGVVAIIIYLIAIFAEFLGFAVWQLWAITVIYLPAAGFAFEAEFGASRGDIVRFVLDSGIHNVSFPTQENAGASGVELDASAEVLSLGVNQTDAQLGKVVVRMP